MAQWFVDNLNPGFPVADISEQVSSWVLHNHPVGKQLEEQVKIAGDDLALIKVLDPMTDPAELAAHVTVDILA